jgi:CBS domain containing-hemolysin-like protein
MNWLAITICLAVSFIFSGIEAGLLSMSRVRLKHRVKLRDRAAIKLDRLLTHPERLLITVLLVTNFMNIVALTLTTDEFVRRLGPRGYLVTLLLALPVYLIGLEVLPKSLFRRFPYRALAALAEPLRLADALLAPVHFVGRGIAKFLFGHRPPNQQKLFVAREDFKYLTIESERTGALTTEERQLIHNVIDFRNLLAKDVMVPREKVQTIAADASIDYLLAHSAETKFDRWPVLAADGTITGLLNVFDIALEGRRTGPVEIFQRRLVKVNANEPAFSALHKLRAARATMALVIDTHGAPLGIVTWEDLIKRLVSAQAA